MECWYASACMVAYYRAPGPRLGLPDRWIPNEGLPVDECVRLAKAEHLLVVPMSTLHWTAGGLFSLLQTYGPIWCAGFWYGFGHVVVLTGISDSTVSINDPDGPARKTGTLDWFNDKLAWQVPGCMLYKLEPG